MQQQSLFIPIGRSNHQLHLRRIWQDEHGPAVLMIHGAIENGRIFYTESGKGLACYLAEQGFDVYVADLRGRGQSIPVIDANADYGQFEAITEDIPAFIDYIQTKKGQKFHVVCHSWGGVLMASYLARFPQQAMNVISKVCFGTKRSISVRSMEKLFKVNIVWNWLAPKLAKRHGYFDAKKLGIGSDNETRKSLLHSIAWVKRSPWIDLEDGFNYQQQVSEVSWPPIWHLTGVNDKVLGHATDVQRFAAEIGNAEIKLSVLSRENGNKRDYDHINILTASEAINDHFPNVVAWMRAQSPFME